MSLKIEDVKVGDGLVCIDVDGFLRINDNFLETRKKILASSLIIDIIYDNRAIGIKDCDLGIPVCDFKYFKKKDQSQYTFDDATDVAYKAYKNCVIDSLMIDRCHKIINFSISSVGYSYVDVIDAKDIIDDIQSLYKETFVIECEEDIKRIKKGAEITLSNGNKSKVSMIFSDKSAIKFEDWDYLLEFFALKGATVEQERGRDE